MSQDWVAGSQTGRGIYQELSRAVPDFGESECAVNFWPANKEACDRRCVDKQLFLERFLPLSILSVAVVLVPLLVWSPSGYPRLTKLRAEQAQVDRTVAELSLEIRKLRAEVERVKADPAHVERAARDELGLVRRTEVVFQFQK
jgi:cell division protein FtsB